MKKTPAKKIELLTEETQGIEPGAQAKIGKNATATITDDTGQVIELDAWLCKNYLSGSSNFEKLVELCQFDGTESLSFQGIVFDDDLAAELEEKFVLVEEA